MDERNVADTLTAREFDGADCIVLTDMAGRVVQFAPTFTATFPGGLVEFRWKNEPYSFEHAEFHLPGGYVGRFVADEAEGWRFSVGRLLEDGTLDEHVGVSALNGGDPRVFDAIN